MSTRSSIWYSERHDVHVYLDVIDEWVWFNWRERVIVPLWPSRRRVQMSLGRAGRLFCVARMHVWAYDGLVDGRMTWRCLTCRTVMP